MSAATKQAPHSDAQSYTNFVNLMALYAEASNRLTTLEMGMQEEWMRIVDENRPEFAKLQSQITEAEEAIEELAILNPQWFKKAKTIKNPYGSVAFRKTTKLVVKNEEATIILIENEGQESKDKYLRQSTGLDLEALEKLEDSDLKKYRITRETTESCTVKPAKIDLGKAAAKDEASAS